MKALLVIVIILILMIIGTYCNTLFRGRTIIWRQVIDTLKMPKTAQIAVLGLNYAGLFIDVAKRMVVPGKVTGVNVGDKKIAEQEKKRIQEARVADRAELVDGSLLNLPLESRHYDYVLSSFTFHGIKPAINRGRAIQEAVRVMKPDGTLVIMDFGNVQQYRPILNNLGITDIRIIPTGYNGWWGGPWLSTKVLIAKR